MKILNTKVTFDDVENNFQIKMLMLNRWYKSWINPWYWTWRNFRLNARWFILVEKLSLLVGNSVFWQIYCTFCVEENWANTFVGGEKLKNYLFRVWLEHFYIHITKIKLFWVLKYPNFFVLAFKERTSQSRKFGK